MWVLQSPVSIGLSNASKGVSNDDECGTTGRERERHERSRAWQRGGNDAGSSDDCKRSGVLCQPEVSLQYQTLAKRSVLRGVESGGAIKEIGRYVTFCDERGERIPWLQPIDSVGVNGRHAVVIAPGLVSVEVFRVRNTYDVLIAKYDVLQSTEGQRGRIEARVLFRGRQGHLPLDLTGDEKGMAGQIVPEFFNKAGEHVEIPPEFVGVLKAAVRGANCVGCTHQHYLTAPKPKAVTTAVARRRPVSRHLASTRWRFERASDDRASVGPLAAISQTVAREAVSGNGACNGTSQECRFGLLPVRCAAGDLQQLLPGKRVGHILWSISRDASSGSCLQPPGAE